MKSTENTSLGTLHLILASMTHAQFIKQRLGKKTDYDGMYAYQCVDLVKQYMKDVYAQEPGVFWGSAAAWYESGSPFSKNSSVWKKTPRAEKIVPSQGDIIFWAASGTNSYGHVAIVDSMSSASKVKVIEQNGSGGGNGEWANAIRYKEYLLKNTLGRYHYRTPLSDADQAVVDIILHNNSKLYNITKDGDLKNLLASTSKKIRELYL